MIDIKYELLQKFIKNAELTTATVQIVSNDENEISNALKSQTYSENKVLISVKNLELLASYLKSVTPIFKPSNEEITSIPFCITDSVGGIAESGSVIISAESGYAAYFTMLTKFHIVLLKASEIYERPRDIFNNKNSETENNKNFSIVTGPSATADMGSLVRGVHGPEHLHIIIIENL